MQKIIFDYVSPHCIANTALWISADPGTGPPQCSDSAKDAWTSTLQPCPVGKEKEKWCSFTCMYTLQLLTLNSCASGLVYIHTYMYDTYVFQIDIINKPLHTCHLFVCSNLFLFSFCFNYHINIWLLLNKVEILM